MTQSHLPRLVSLSNATFRRNTRVKAIATDRDGRISHLEVASASDRSARIQARFYVLACGGIETPRLLLRSLTPAFPRGIGNEHDNVGRHFMEHLSVALATLTLPKSIACPTDREVIESISWQFMREFRALGLGSVIFEFAVRPSALTVDLSVIVEMWPSASNRVELSATDVDRHGEQVAAVTLHISDSERRAWAHAQVVGKRIAGAIGAQEAHYANGDFRWCHHHMGTCRMGRNARTSVVNEHLKVHNVDNLYVSGSSTFVTGSVGSPTLLLTALTLRLADHLAARL